MSNDKTFTLSVTLKTSMHQKKEKNNPQSTLPYPRSVVINSMLMLFSEFTCEIETAVALETQCYSGVPCAFHFTARSLNACRFKTAKVDF